MDDYAKLLAAHKRLRDGYADAVAGLRYVLQEHGRLSGVGFDRVDDEFFAAVEMREREGLLAGSEDIPLNPKPLKAKRP